MASRGYGNFTFLYDINREIYNYASTAEKEARIDFENCGTNIRKAYEAFANSVVAERSLAGMLKERADLSDKIFYFRTNNIILNLPKFKYLDKDGKEQMGYGLDLIRWIGNATSHTDKEEMKALPCYSNLVLALSLLHRVFAAYYKRKVSIRIPEFNEQIMPIGEYHVTETSVPYDAEKTGCIREAKAYLLDEEEDISAYAILRIYEKDEISETTSTFMLRNQKCFTMASKYSISTVPEGMALQREVIEKGSPKTNFYIVAYEFSREPRPLDDSLVGEMTTLQKTKFCSRLVDSLAKLHGDETRIIHRMLNYRCIYACKFGDEWVPYIIKFDYAKIVSSKTVATVYMDAEKAAREMDNMLISKYIAPEWERLGADAGADEWSLVDIYSLGVLFADIYAGKFTGRVVDLDSLEVSGVSDNILDTIDCMTAESPSARGSLNGIKNTFDVELKKNNAFRI